MSTTESFIEVSEEELNDEEDEIATIREMEPRKEASEDQREEEKSSDGSLSEAKEDDDDDNNEIAAPDEKEPEEGTEGESSAAPAANEWEDFDAVRKMGYWFRGKIATFCLTCVACCCRTSWRSWTAPCRRSKAT